MTNKKRISSIVLLLLVITLAAWVHNRWDAWFVTSAEPQFSVAEAPHNIQLTFGNSGTEERVVTWQSAIRNNAVLKYTNTNNADTVSLKPFVHHFKNNSGELYYYKAQIPTPSADVYHYSIIEGDVETEWYRFAVNHSDTFSILCLGDIQNTVPSLYPLIDSIVDFAAPDFIIQAGDLIERPQMRYWDVYFADFKNITPHVPMLTVLGNHDYCKSPNSKPDIRFFLTFPYFFASEPDINAPVCFSMKYGKVYYHLFDTNASIFSLARQAKMFKAQKYPKDAFHVAIMHHPPYSARSSWHNLDIRLALSDALSNAGVDLVIAGHEHVHSYRPTSDDIPFAQSISHLSQKNYSNSSSNTRTFAILKCEYPSLSYLIYDEYCKLISSHIIEK